MTDEAKQVPDEDQMRAMGAFAAGQSFVLTGPAGVGKTRTLKACIAHARKKTPNRFVAVTASTGIAACALGGATLHSWAGIGIANTPVHKLVAQHWWKNSKAHKRINGCHTLIIDEVSMLDGHIIDYIDEVFRIARNSDMPFGGIQMVFVGDWGQLPPVKARGGFAFDSRVWSETQPEIIELRTVHRQHDPVFIKALMEVRSGKVSPQTEQLFWDRVFKTQEMHQEGGDAAFDNVTRLLTHRADVDRINAQKLAELPGELFRFCAKESGPEKLLNTLRDSCPAPDILELKVGAAVLMLTNDSEGRWVNGTRGVIKGFLEGLGGEPVPMVKIGEQTYPLTHHEWAITEDGRPPRRQLWGDDDSDGPVHRPDQIATRQQYPCKLGFALSIHKAQGATLDSALIEVSKAFAPGQVYVALSRVRSLEGLYIQGWNPAAIYIAPEVADFLARNNVA
jgi:ATP-dependent DNA helicase PIF1